MSFSQRFKELRKSKNLSQETVAEKLGITSQAVSKWECSLSYPDIELLPAIAEMFSVSIDSLFKNDLSYNSSNQSFPFPDDNRIRLLRLRGHNIIEHMPYDSDMIIFQNESENTNETVIEVWGDCIIEGDLHNKLTCAGNVECNNIAGNAAAGGNIECEDICGNAVAHGNIECNSVYGNTRSDDTRLSDPKDCIQYNFDTEWAEQLRTQVTSSVKEAMGKIFGELE